MSEELYKLVGRKVGMMRQADDFYPTPEYVTRALMDRIKFVGEVWEPACGDGRMSEVIKDYGNHVISTDLVDRGYWDGMSGIDFLMECDHRDNIITNPPFSLAYAFLEQALRLANKRVAMLLPVRYLTGKKRVDLFSRRPPRWVIVIPNKVDFVGIGNPAMEFAWFVWDKNIHNRVTELMWAEWHD